MSSIYDILPVVGGAAVTPSDTTVLNSRTRSLWVGTTGNVKVTTWDGSVLTFPNVPVGWLDVKAKIVWSAGTTASNIVAVW